MTLRFTVVGKAQPAGSKRAVPNSRDWRTRAGVTWKVIDANPDADRWKQTVATTARGALLAYARQTGESIVQPMFDVPVEVSMIFRRARPESHVNTKGEPNAEGLRHPFPDAKPDVLKLARAVEDALTGIVYADDARIVRELLVKEWGERDEVEIAVGFARTSHDTDSLIEVLHAEVAP